MELLTELRAIVGKDGLRTQAEECTLATANSLGVDRQICGLLFPQHTDQIVALVKLANRERLQLYPISRGFNIGYGEKAPVQNGQWLVDLGRMNRIRHFDPVRGSVTLEPGVTQAQLYSYLREKQAPFWMDATGSGLEASIIGNTLEGGFGHTPMGNHRALIGGVEAVLGNGQLLRTGEFPNLGPDLAPLFVQSNFAVITAMDVPLMPIPEAFCSYVLQVPSDEGLESMVETFRGLRHQGIVSGLVHMANALRSLMTTRKLPPEFAGKRVTPEDAVAIMSAPLMKMGYWNAVGGVFGTRKEVQARKEVLKKNLGKIGRVKFLTDRGIERLLWLSRRPLLQETRFGKRLQEGMTAFLPIHRLMQGVPSDYPLNNILWRVDDRARLGLLWFAPCFSATGEQARTVMRLADPLHVQYGFETSVTFTLVSTGRMVGVFSITFDKSDKDQVTKAHQLYRQLKQTFAQNHIHPYRSPILDMESIRYPDPGKQEIFSTLKSTFDPNGVISPGRYGIYPLAVEEAPREN